MEPVLSGSACTSKGLRKCILHVTVDELAHIHLYTPSPFSLASTLILNKQTNKKSRLSKDQSKANRWTNSRLIVNTALNLNMCVLAKYDFLRFFIYTRQPVVPYCQISQQAHFCHFLSQPFGMSGTSAPLTVSPRLDLGHVHPDAEGTPPALRMLVPSPC